jgi:glyoxylase-like metal-dependent hydrolase (beta-lactamase superfamily II)
VSGHVLPLAGSAAPWHGGVVTDSAICVLAPNPSPWTLDGTNTWLLSAPGTRDAIVIDPGPLDESHSDAIRRAAADHDLRIRGILLTHGHVDHAEGARALADALGVGVRALDPAHRLGSEGLAPGDVVSLGDGEVTVVGTPGHTADSVSFLLRHDGSLLTGDTVLGRGTSLVAWPDGRLGDYLDSLARLRDLTEGDQVLRLLPGHGPALQQPARVIDDYLAHRRARLAEVASAVGGGLTEPRAIVESVYADVSPLVWPAAELTVRAQLEYLEAADATPEG